MTQKHIKKEVKFFLIKNLLAYPIYYLLRIYSHTLRFKLENADSIIENFKNGNKIILASWHQRFFGGFYLPKLFGWKIPIMISQSQDGDFIADAVQRIGWAPVRGSSSRRGREALKEMVHAVKTDHIASHIVDGPTGPPTVIKPGLISLARESGAGIVRACVSYENAIVFNSWDRFMIPKPFSRVLIRFGELEWIPQELNSEEYERYREKIEVSFRDGYKDVDRFWNEDKKKSGFKFLGGIKKEIRR